MGGVLSLLQFVRSVGNNCILPDALEPMATDGGSERLLV